MPLEPAQSGRWDAEVAISGGGPVGLCLALLLARVGVTVQLFEAEDDVVEDLRASTFHPRRSTCSIASV